MDINYQFRWQQFALRLMDDLVHHPDTILPGIQVLGKRYKVSRITVEHALKHLEGHGVIAPAERGKKRKIDLAKLQTITELQNKRARRIFFLSTDPASNPSYMTRTVYASIRELCERDQLISEYVEIPDSLDGLRSLLVSIPPRGIVLYVVSNKVEELVYSLCIPAISIDGRARCIPRFNTSYSGLLLSAFQQAHDVGHRRITAPLWKKKTVLCEQLAVKVGKHFPGGSDSFSRRYNLPSFEGNTPKEYQAALRNIFRYTPPTCLVFGNLPQYLMAISFFLKTGLRIPDDVSVILLSNDPYLDSISPSTAHFVQLPEDLITKAFHVLQEQMRGFQSCEKRVIFPVWVPGDSLAPPKSR